ncbi:MAG: hypothetical protein GKR97_11805 [Rhizobiaceae bacterium]|nr:hypothetical protein [Rhizobiaceae bacterium]
MNAVLILGSAPDAIRVRDFDLSGFSAIVAINNAWQLRDDWTHVVYPEDFAESRRPTNVSGKSVIEYDQFVPANNRFGGTIYAGGTMAFTGGYWALAALKPGLMAFLGCDMVYDGDPEDSHFYGQGEPDPLRDDPTLQCLEAKSERLRWMAFDNQCLCLNLSEKPKSRLTFDRLDSKQLGSSLVVQHGNGLQQLNAQASLKAAERALAAEKRLDYFVESGDYWNADLKLDAQKLAQIDTLWLQVFQTGRQ